MTDRPINVLLPMACPTQNKLRTAISKIICGVQHDTCLTDEELADELGISVGTVRNSRNRLTDLNATTIARIGAKWGVERLDPYSALWGARNVPLQCEEADALPSLSAAVHHLAVAQSPTSPGGATVMHRELLDMLPDLRAAQARINALIVRAERIAA